MKKILLTGRIDEALSALDKALSLHYSVRFGSSVALAALGILESFHPDLIVSRISETDSSVFARIKAGYGSIPLVLIGTREEAGRLQFPSAVLCESEEQVPEAVNGIFAGDTGENGDPVRTVMVVDDDPAMLRMVKIMLESEYDLVLAPSGAKALKLLERKVPDVILLDYEMPDMNGVETLGKLRAEPGYADIPVIFLTGMSDTSILDVIQTCGVSGHLVKPADAANIKAAIKSVLKK